MNPEKSEIGVSETGISRRKMLKRIGAGAAVAWTAPVLTSLRTPALAVESPCDPGAPCNLLMPCNVPIPCQNGNVNCNCWVNSAHTACFCGNLESCDLHQPCGPGDSCPYGQVCVENCCGKLCYGPCNLGSGGGGNSGAAYGTK